MKVLDMQADKFAIYWQMKAYDMHPDKNRVKNHLIFKTSDYYLSESACGNG